MKRLVVALNVQYGNETPPALARVLAVACRRETITFDEIKKIEKNSIEDLLLFAWSHKLLIPQAFSKSGEWDHRILVMEPGEVYEIPNISRYLIKTAADTGKWDIRGAVARLYKDMGEPRWDKMPDLVNGITQYAVNYTISAAMINAVCTKTGISHKTGAMIAILKGGGIISPKLAALDPVVKARGPVYEVNPSVYSQNHFTDR